MTTRLPIAILGAYLGVVTLLGTYVDYGGARLPGYVLLAIGICGLMYASLSQGKEYCEADAKIRRGIPVLMTALALILGGLLWLDHVG